jgi:hypothetical protein
LVEVYQKNNEQIYDIDINLVFKVVAVRMPFDDQQPAVDEPGAFML